ncbi:MAG: glycosyl transferase family 2 [Verrucomicrobiales bacterium]|nr:glycosyl transferase family 2 [Verrucomicrobiales bacterium]
MGSGSGRRPEQNTDAKWKITLAGRVRWGLIWGDAAGLPSAADFPPYSYFVKTLLVIPCLRERARLPTFLPALLSALDETAPGGVEVLIVDDGSGAEEQEWLRGYVGNCRTDFPNLLPPVLLSENTGKGGAVYAGWTQAGAAHSHVGFVDADGAIPPEETARLCALATHSPTRTIYAVRTGTEDTVVQRHPGRGLAGQMFRLLVRSLFHFPVPETQCGCKILPRTAWQACAPHLQEKRFCFDVELTWHLLHQGTEIHPVPVNWREIPGGQLRAGSIFSMIRSLIRLRLKLGPWQPGDPGTPH